jgi:methyl-accepting chemotaxis protein
MMNLSSLSIIKLALTVSILFVLSGTAISFMHGIPVWITEVVSLSALFCLAGTFFYLRKLEKEFKRTTHVCKDLAQGNFETRLTHIKEQGLVGDMMWSVNEMADHVDAFVREARAAMEYVSRNQYFRTILEDGLHGSVLTGARIMNRAMNSVEEKMNGFNQVAEDVDGSLKDVVKEIQNSVAALQDMTESMENVVNVTREGSENAIRFSDETSQNVQTISAAAEEMSSSIAEISQQMNRTSEIAKGAVTKAKESGDMIEALAEMASNIGEVISVIEDIAEQTNLLALNATIEAARAGEAGKGFAVVASEVKQLAGQTAKATEQIGTQIHSIQQATQGAVAAFSEIGNVVTEINESATIVAAAIEEQNTASREIASSAESASTGTTQVASNIHEMGRSITQVDESSKQVGAITDKLAHYSKDKVEGLLADMGKFMEELKKIA